MSLIDLHSHSKFSSDAQFPPEVLIEMAQAQQVSTLALTDHNSTRGIASGLIAAERVAGFQFLPGIEIDAGWGDLGLHILGIGIDHTAPIFADIEAHALVAESAYTNELGDGFRSLGLHVDRAIIDEGRPRLSPELLIRTILTDPLNRDHDVMAPYFNDGPRSDMPLFNVFVDYCLPGTPLFVTRDYMSVEDALHAIHSNGGTSFLAHPGGSLRDHHAQLNELFECGVQGVEALSTYHSREQSRSFALLASERAKLISCGSDFHGAAKPKIQLGQVDYSEFIHEVTHARDVIVEKMSAVSL